MKQIFWLIVLVTLVFALIAKNSKPSRTWVDFNRMDTIMRHFELKDTTEFDSLEKDVDSDLADNPDYAKDYKKFKRQTKN